jgi:predicted ester cyclase
VDAAERYLAPRYTIHHDPGDPWDGCALDLEGYKDRVRRSRAPFPDQRFDIQGLYADGDAVGMTWLLNATHLSDIPGFAATGKTIRMSGATTYFFAPGGLSGHWQIMDWLGVFRRLQSNRSP